MPIDDARQVALKIAEALEYAHERGIVHRDLKPANIKITPDGTVKVLDFGLAKAVFGDTTTSSPASTPTILPTVTSAGTAIGMILGTAAYMSPEQARGKPVDKRADIWAFGVVLYEMLTGTRLFAGETVSDVLAAVLTREPDWKALPSPTPVAVRRLLARCLDRDARKRLRDIGEAALLLADPGSYGGSPEPVASARSVTRELAAWATAALAVVLAVVTAVWAPWGRSGSGATGPLHFSLSTSLSEGAPEEAVIAPDGLRVAFVGRLPGAATDTIFVLPLREAASKSLAGTEGASRPAFSPDGKWLVFFAHNRSLKKIPADGGSVVDLASGNFRYAQAVWTDTGRILLTVFNWDQPGLLHEILESGGPPIAIPGRPEHAAEAAIDPLALPGGRAVLVRTGRDFSVLAVHSLDTGERRVLAQNALSARFVGGNVIWLENDKLMAAPFDPGLLAFSSAPVAIPTDGLFTGGPRGSQPTAKPLLTDPFNETSVRISPDGRWIVYASDESGRNEIYARAFPDLGSKVQISVAGGTEPVWHPGGGEIVYRSTASRDFMSVTVQVKGALAVSPPRVLASDAGLSRGELDHTQYAVARDGRLLAVQAASSDARDELGFVLGWAQAAGLLR